MPKCGLFESLGFQAPSLSLSLSLSSTLSSLPEKALRLDLTESARKARLGIVSSGGRGGVGGTGSLRGLTTMSYFSRGGRGGSGSESVKGGIPGPYSFSGYYCGSSYGPGAGEVEVEVEVQERGHVRGEKKRESVSRGDFVNVGFDREKMEKMIPAIRLSAGAGAGGGGGGVGMGLVGGYVGADEKIANVAEFALDTGLDAALQFSLGEFGVLELEGMMLKERERMEREKEKEANGNVQGDKERERKRKEKNITDSSYWISVTCSIRVDLINILRLRLWVYLPPPLMLPLPPPHPLHHLRNVQPIYSVFLLLRQLHRRPPLRPNSTNRPLNQKVLKPKQDLVPTEYHTVEFETRLTSGGETEEEGVDGDLSSSRGGGSGFDSSTGAMGSEEPGSGDGFLEAAARRRKAARLAECEPLKFERRGGEVKSFHVVALSRPGYGFSEAPRKTGFAADQYAEVGHKLMLALGYNKYGRFSTMVKNNMAQISLQSLKEGIGIMPVISLKYGTNHSKAWHTNSPADALPPRLWSNPIAYIQHMLLSYTAAAKAGLERSAWFQKEGRGCYSEQSTQPQTPGYSLTDSPECEWMMRLQDIPDQSAIARQYTRYTAQINIVQVVALALQIATTEPKGPVFLCACCGVIPLLYTTVHKSSHTRFPHGSLPLRCISYHKNSSHVSPCSYYHNFSSWSKPRRRCALSFPIHPFSRSTLTYITPNTSHSFRDNLQRADVVLDLDGPWIPSRCVSKEDGVFIYGGDGYMGCSSAELNYEQIVEFERTISLRIEQTNQDERERKTGEEGIYRSHGTAPHLKRTPREVTSSILSSSSSLISERISNCGLVWEYYAHRDRARVENATIPVANTRAVPFNVDNEPSPDCSDMDVVPQGEEEEELDAEERTEATLFELSLNQAVQDLCGVDPDDVPDIFNFLPDSAKQTSNDRLHSDSESGPTSFSDSTYRPITPLLVEDDSSPWFLAMASKCWEGL
ncbi:hypothetical protein D9757_013247 [Collybiopsis confluens]|uniref:Uncharacterized protein n=1 Tax=Collybiopsis confluens TaxID=2823264 RepID=A0A8H5D2F9_9AGAR|nr:hypothetical protein D9757_013247 [Collybiopsis confluens]